jgi:hypothetical protein
MKMKGRMEKMQIVWTNSTNPFEFHAKTAFGKGDISTMRRRVDAKYFGWMQVAHMEIRSESRGICLPICWVAKKHAKKIGR